MKLDKKLLVMMKYICELELNTYKDEMKKKILILKPFKNMSISKDYYEKLIRKMLRTIYIYIYAEAGPRGQGVPWQWPTSF